MGDNKTIAWGPKYAYQCVVHEKFCQANRMAGEPDPNSATSRTV